MAFFYFFLLYWSLCHPGWDCLLLRHGQFSCFRRCRLLLSFNARVSHAISELTLPACFCVCPNPLSRVFGTLSRDRLILSGLCFCPQGQIARAAVVREKKAHLPLPPAAWTEVPPDERGRIICAPCGTRKPQILLQIRLWFFYKRKKKANKYTYGHPWSLSLMRYAWWRLIQHPRPLPVKNHVYNLVNTPIWCFHISCQNKQLTCHHSSCDPPMTLSQKFNSSVPISNFSNSPGSLRWWPWK